MLIGPPGSGKTSVGLALAQRLAIEFIDSDAVIEKTTGMKVSHIFEKLGERAFRQMERKLVLRLHHQFAPEPVSVSSNVKENGTLSELSSYQFPPSFILSAGGGLPVKDNNMDLILQSCLVIALSADEDELLRRLSGRTDRPLLASGKEDEGARLKEMRDNIARLVAERRTVYERAHITVETGGRTVEQIADELVSLIKVQG